MIANIGLIDKKLKICYLHIAKIMRRLGVYYNNTCHGKIDTFQKYLESYDDYWN